MLYLNMEAKKISNSKIDKDPRVSAGIFDGKKGGEMYAGISDSVFGTNSRRLHRR